MLFLLAVFRKGPDKFLSLSAEIAVGNTDQIIPVDDDEGDIVSFRDKA
jgi:hypothetical protein